MRNRRLNVLTRVLCCLCLALFTASNALPGTPSRPNSLLIHTIRKFDEWGNISTRDERARLDNLAAHLMLEPNMIAYIMVYAGKRACPGEASVRAQRAKAYLISRRHINGRRIVPMEGGFRNELTVEVWLFPLGISPPTASPSVDPSEVRVTKRCDAQASRHRRTKQ